jgi:P-type Cu2+ transporter
MNHQSHHTDHPEKDHAGMMDHGEHHPPPTSGRPERGAAAHEMHGTEEFQRRFWICLALTIPVLAYTPEVQELLHFSAPSFPGSIYVPLVFASAIYFYGGATFLRSAYYELRALTPGMATLVSLAITVAYVYSLASEFLPGGQTLYWELATLIVIMLLGHWLEMRAVGRAQSALTELAKLLPDKAERIVGDRVEEVSLDQLRVGDVVLVRPGARVPADGMVIEGESQLNESMITGESRPVAKKTGDRAIAGTVNGAGSLRLRVIETGESTVLASIMRLVQQAQTSRSRAQALADRAAYWLTLIAIGVGLATFAVWLVLGAGGGFALERTVTVLVIACPHALGLAIPLVLSISTTLAARNGLIVRERLALENARNLDLVVFDKTGTLTKGEQGVVGVIAADGLTEDEALAEAAALERDSEHAIGQAIRAEADRRSLKLVPVVGFEALPGRGVRGRLDGSVVEIGGPRLLEQSGVDLPPPLRAVAGQWGAEGKTTVYLLRNGQPVAAIALADIIREESRQAVAELKRMGLRVAMLTGDSEDVAKWVARELGIDEYFAEVLPGDKADKMSELKQRGLRVAMVGDGINDAPALLTADVGIAIGAGTDVALESAGIVLVKNDPRDVVRVIALSRASYRKMRQNLAWAVGYNVVAIPLAAGALSPFGLVLVPAVGALFMSLSTIVVAINAQLLRRLRL